MKNASIAHLDLHELREEIRKEYRVVADEPEQGFHFHTGRRLGAILEYDEELLDVVPESSLESFAGTGNPFSLGVIHPGETVVDLGCGAGTDSHIAAFFVGRKGRVIGIDMTPEMIEKAKRSAGPHQPQLTFRSGYLERLPVADASVDVVLSNGVVNLCPDKARVYREIVRVLKPGGRMQIADITLTKPLSDEAKMRPDLWTG